MVDAIKGSTTTSHDDTFIPCIGADYVGACGLQPPMGNATGGSPPSEMFHLLFQQSVLIVYQLLCLVGMSFLSISES